MEQRRRRPLFVLLVASSLLTSCAAFHARQDLRDGLLVLDLPQRDFLAIWDRPTRTSAISGDEIIKSGIAGWGGFFFKGREMYEMWEYEGRQTRLVFYDKKLVAWKTSMTVQKLAAPEPDYLLDGRQPKAEAATLAEAPTTAGTAPAPAEAAAPTTPASPK